LIKTQLLYLLETQKL